MVNQHGSLLLPAETRVRDHTRAALVEQPKLHQLKREERQRVAEMLISNTLLLATQRWSLLAQGNSAQLQAAVAHYRQVGIDTLHVDWMALNLTDEGLVSRVARRMQYGHVAA